MEALLYFSACLDSVMEPKLVCVNGRILRFDSAKIVGKQALVNASATLLSLSINVYLEQEGTISFQGQYIQFGMPMPKSLRI